MGNWQLEVGRMAFYLAFPVFMFHYFNQPDNFEEWVIKTKRNLYPPVNEAEQQLIDKTKAEIKRRRNEEILAALNEVENKA